MQVSDKLIRPLTEAKYLNADNVSRYRCIMLMRSVSQRTVSYTHLDVYKRQPQRSLNKSYKSWNPLNKRILRLFLLLCY